MEEGSPAQEEVARPACGARQGCSPEVTSFRVTGLDHVNITTPQELEADVVDWYQSVLQLESIEKPQGTSAGGSWFGTGDVEIHISRDPHSPPQRAHFCLRVDDLDAAIESLRSAGYHIEQATPIVGRRRFFTRDPAGNRVELMS